MKHASKNTIQRLAPFLEQVRRLPSLKEKKPGVYYLRSKAFMHFHEEGVEIYADVRLTQPGFDRFHCSTKQQQQELLRLIAKALAC